MRSLGWCGQVEKEAPAPYPPAICVSDCWAVIPKPVHVLLGG